MDDWANVRVLVTGGSGFVGRALIDALGQRGTGKVIAPTHAEYDLTLAEDVKKMFAHAEPDIVIHLAARVGGIGANMAHPAELYLDNLLMGTYLLEEARHTGVHKTVLLGTICAYPKFTPVPFSEAELWNGYPEETNAPYGLAKKALLVHAQANHLQYGQKSIYLLPTNLYGPGDKFHPSVSHVIPALIRKCVQAKEMGDDSIEVWGTGKATREFLFVDDAVEGILLATEHYDEPEPVNLGSGREVSIGEIAQTIARLVGFEGELRWDSTKPDGQPRRRVDTTRAEKAFGFTARTRLEDGLRSTIDWYVANRVEAESHPF